ncbi:hypothetical protein SARC_07730 [Sphaeroforma arctica JP610]|uniref:Uncharacterized protein n=1 Tax=Sphaeroforma arctica JP610 TaxID=667725 RepID=A0A0L0FTJ2_9EUKA|nr:hypothetical protein SARC_07730 [Sphaeroforma arctica JP610]KNC79891.1 hypothetical protein SARC_07730 [Sphaeroforma arctica JP610]|eukprot:XP_014153793.1 hypothetical protein SARC_07730 [Sphaeroforma arctica JP610]
MNRVSFEIEKNTDKHAEANVNNREPIGVRDVCEDANNNDNHLNSAIFEDTEAETLDRENQMTRGSSETFESVKGSVKQLKNSFVAEFKRRVKEVERETHKSKKIA